MTTAGWVALGITVFGAFSYAAASILQAVAARRSANTVQTVSHPLYLIGIGCDALAWVGSMIALRELAVYLVESILAGSLAITVVAARFILRSRLRRRDIAAVTASVAALAVLALSAGPQQDVTASTGMRLVFCGAAGVMVLLGWGATRLGSPGLVAALGGLCLGGAALAGRAMPAAPMDVLTEPLTLALLAFAVTGMLMYAHALQIGQVGPVTAVHWTAEVVAPSAVALLLLGDTVRAGWGLPAAVAGLVIIGAAILLATAPANNATHRPEALPAAPPRPELAAAAPPVPHRAAERVIWWGAPPIWIPPGRTTAALAAPVARELDWSPPAGQPAWTEPLRPDAGQEPIPMPARAAPHRPAPRPPWPAEPDAAVDQPAGSSPWHDL